MQVPVSEQQVQDLLTYLQEFYKWNQVYNLSAIREPEAMVSLHLLDSLALYPYLQNVISEHPQAPRLLDVGTGGGLPGIPLAIVFPDLAVTLLDSNGKKTRFLFQVATKLHLNNISVETCRVEKYQPDLKFDFITSRAYASLFDMISGTSHLLSENGQFWAMKGVYPDTELASIGACELTACHSLLIPGVTAERHLVVLKKSDQQT